VTDVGIRTSARVSWRWGSTSVLAGTGVLLGLAVGELARVQQPLSAVFMAVCVVAAGAVFVRGLGWSVGLAVLLVVTCLIDRNTFAVGRLNTRPEHVAAALALLVFVVSRIRAGRSLLVRPDRAEAALLAWFAIALLSSVVVAPNRADSVKVLALLLVSSLALFLPRRLLADRRSEVEQLVGWTLIALALESGYAYLAYMLHLFGPTISIGFNSATAHLDAYGTLWEPNVLGAFAGAGAVAWAFIGPRLFRHSWIGVALCLSACAASFARAAWLAVFVVFLVTLVTPIRRQIDLKALLLGAAGATVLVIAILAADNVGTYTLIGRGGVGGSVGNAADLLGRFYQVGPALSDLKHQPIIGRGVDSFGQLHVLQGMPEHLTNLELAIAHDTGALGLIAFAAFVVFVIIAAWRARANLTVLGLAATILVIAITNQATETLELMVTWLLIGLLLAAVDAAQDPATRPGIARTAPRSGS
jgi:O-Antigen ligase